LYFSQLLLYIIQKFNGERSFTAPYYLLKGKKSGQTMQDVTYFQLHSFFSIYSNLKKEEYDLLIFALQAEGLVEIEEGVLSLTQKGKDLLDDFQVPVFDGWSLRGNEIIFWRRLELVVQTISNFHAGESKFIPNQKDLNIQQFVRNYLRGKDYKAPTFTTIFKKQLIHLMEKATLTDTQKTLFVYRFSGFQVSGLTWEQLAHESTSSVHDVKLQFIEILHKILGCLTEEEHPDIFPLTDGIFVKTPLTESAYKTSLLLEKGYTLEQVAAARNLKVNTIEDHLIEIASANPAFSVENYISLEQMNRVWEISASLHTKKLRLIKEQLPELSYFMIRLALSKGGKENG